MLPQSIVSGQPRRRLQTLYTRQSLVTQILLLILVFLACPPPSACIRKTSCKNEISIGMSHDPVETEPYCRDEEDSFPLSIYLEELYERMALVNESTSQRLHDEGKWGRILAVPKAGGNRRRQSFNVTTLRSYNNFSTAKVAVVPADNYYPKPCEAGLTLIHRHQGRLPCEDQPFMVRNMATFDVTSVLSSALERSEETFTVKASDSVPTSLLVVFIDAEDLLTDKTPQRCRAPSRSKRDTDNLARLWKTFQQRESHSRSEPTTKKILQAESNVIYSPQNQSSAASRLTYRPSGSAGMKKRHHGQRHRGGKQSSTILAFNKQEHQRWAKGASKAYIDEEKATKQHLQSDDDEGENERMHNSEGHSTISWKRTSFSDEMGKKLKRTVRPHSPALLSRLGSRPVFQTHSQLEQHLNKRWKRLASQRARRDEQDSCQLRPFALDPVKDLRMPPFIRPQLLHIGLCLGGCPPVLQPNSFVPYYTHLISLINVYQGQHRTQSPTSCRPTGFRTFQVIRWTTFDAEVAIMETWFNASVTACRCMI